MDGNDTAGSGPLDGVTVVSFEQAVAAPFATRQLADLGARVVKIERPGGGDFARGYDRTVKGLASHFVWLNRSKESVTLDLAHPAAGEVLDRLLAGADVVVQNLAPGSAERFGLGAPRLRARDPRLIVCDVSGYGTTGPFAGRRAYDLLVQCETGVLSVTGTPQQPAKVGISVADIAAGMYAYSSILGALYSRERTGVGAALDVSLFASLAEWMSQPLYYAMYTGAAPPRTGTSHATIAPYGTFRTADGAVQLGVQNEREWERLCTQVLDRPALAVDARFADNGLRVRHRDQLTVAVEAAFATLGTAEVLRRLDAAQIANGAYNTVTDLLAHPQLDWGSVDTPSGPVPVLLPPVRIAGFEPVLGAVPEVGEHTGTVLAGLGFDEATIAGWREAGVV